MKINFANRRFHMFIAVLYSVLFSVLVVLMGRLGLKTFIGCLLGSMSAFLIAVHIMADDIVLGMNHLPRWFNRLSISLFYIVPSFTSFAMDMNKISFFSDSKIYLNFSTTFWITVIICYLLLYKAYIVTAWVYAGYLRDKGKLHD